MRIPLDYYRILGLPIQATAEQLKQSHRDRTLQVPRREYSELAIEARRQLIDMAYSVLGDNMRRAEYDQEFLAASKSAGQSLGQSAGPGAGETEDLDAHVPSIDIESHQLVGGLLILLELGEYELVLRLGRAYLKRDDSSTEGQQLKTQPALPDIILSLAVACLELGREEWQQNHYEHAAESLETGRELLLREDLFPVLRAEIQADLYKLRPYRCLELIARPLEQKQLRREGINLLRGMLQDRGGIDGADDDLSGLGVDDFLRFVQQLRGYLTAAEQQEVFEAEAQRPSAVGTYLAVYALLARGFAQHQPALIGRAKQLLLRLSGRQDVHLEQAVCAVLLGQTEEASRALELSQEYEPLAFIREHSQGSPDLLPGLCLYAENWLQQEVFPFFRDLDQAPATLKDYFADSSVQTFLENLPLANERGNRQSAWAQSVRETAPDAFSGRSVSPALTAASFGQSGAPEEEAESTYEGPLTLGSSELSDRPPIASGTGIVTGTTRATNPTSIAEKISQLSPTGQLGGSPAVLPEPPARSREIVDPAGGTALRERRSRRPSPKWGRLAVVILAGLLCLGLAGILARRVIGLLGGSGSSPNIEGEPLDLEINQPPIETESADTAAAPAPADAAGIAKATITQWLETKQVAYASDHDASGLENVLTGSALSRSQGKVQTAQTDDWYVDYTHGDVKVLSVEPADATDANQLAVQAEVTESATFYEAGQRVDQYSYTDDVVVIGYDLVRQDGQWLIEQFR